MRVPLQLSYYILRIFLKNVLITFCTFAVLIILLDGLEIIRRSESRDISPITVLQLTLLKFPLMGEKVMPFVILFATLSTYTGLSKKHELDIIRASGVSVWQFLAPAALGAFGIGLIVVTLLNPLTTAMLAKYEQQESEYILEKSSTLTLSQTGLWLKQRNLNSLEEAQTGETIIHAKHVRESQNTIILKDVMILIFSKDGYFIKRIDSSEAELLNSFWQLKNVHLVLPEGITHHYDEYFLETELNVNDIYDSFARPETISFWSLPNFIDTLKKSGFSAIPHLLHFHRMLASPLFYMAMVCIAALFSLKPYRQGKTGLFITASILCGFIIYFLTNLIYSMGLSGALPAFVAAWIPVCIVLLSGIGLLLHFEDG